MRSIRLAAFVSLMYKRNQESCEQTVSVFILLYIQFYILSAVFYSKVTELVFGLEVCFI